MIRGKLAENWLKLVRLYTFNAPVRKGKYRLFQLAMRLCDELPTELPALATDGRKLNANLASGMCDQVFFLGEYERYVTKVMKTVVRKGDVCLDVGANFGWFTTLLHRAVTGENGTKSGEVHAFEPMPTIFQDLQKNYRLAGSPENVFLNNFALGDKFGEIKMHIFPDLPNGHASISAMDRTDFIEYRADMKTLDSYLIEKGIGRVNFLKADIEGAELMFLKGAGKLFEQKIPPIIMMEMALATTKSFGYLPNDLIQFIKSRGDYRFFVLDELKFQLEEIEGFTLSQIGANVLCLPKSQFDERSMGLEFIDNK
jgi:FkbM family methyltransferase